MRHEVTDADTAAALGSGDVPVLGTPRLIAWMEAATVQAAAASLNPGQTTVGISIRSNTAVKRAGHAWRSPQLHRVAAVVAF